MEVLDVKERVQAGSQFLFKFNCPGCRDDYFGPYPFVKCKSCELDLSDFEFKIKHARLLCGTRRRPGAIKKSHVQYLLEVQGPNCAYCFGSFDSTGYHVEHIIPLCVGGTNKIDNLCLSCPKCNLIAGKKYFSTFEAKRSFIQKRRKVKDT